MQQGKRRDGDSSEEKFIKGELPLLELRSET